MTKNSGHKSKWELVTIPCTKDILPITRGIVPKPADYVPERICHIFGDILFIGMRNVILYTFLPVTSVWLMSMLVLQNLVNIHWREFPSINL